MLTKEEMPACPVATTVQLIGSKWKLLILRDLLMRPWRFNELRRDLEGISQKVLTDSLRTMEEDGLVSRTVYPEVPPKVEYSLTPLGESMKPILDAMEQWGTEYKSKFREIIFDFRGISFMGQGFADEVFRVFQNAHPDIKLTAVNANASVEGMIRHVKRGEM